VHLRQFLASRVRWVRRLTLSFIIFSFALPWIASGETVIDIYGPSIPRFPICVFPFDGGAGTSQPMQQVAQEAHRIMTLDLKIAGFFEILDPAKALADPFRRGFGNREVDWDLLRLLGADIIVGGRVRLEGPKINWEVRVYDQPQKRMVLGKAYRGRPEDLAVMVHRLVDEIIEQYTGTPGIFQTQIAFLSKQKDSKDIYLMSPDGEGIRPLTQDQSINLSPRWSPNGKEMVFISYSGANSFLHHLALDTMSRRILSARENMNGPACWSPDGRLLALTLTIDGNPELYLIDTSGAIVKRLTHYPGIDVSPTWSPDGKDLAFVSNRSGSPQIYILELASGKIRRLTFEGDYNTDPAWSPLGDRIAYSASVNGSYEICTIRPDGKDFTRLTSSPGDDETPSWSPDGRYLAFSSTRSGSPQIFVMLYNGDNQTQITRIQGKQTSPAWSPRLEGK
jgi:TolB protein